MQVEISKLKYRVPIFSAEYPPVYKPGIPCTKCSDDAAFCDNGLCGKISFFISLSLCLLIFRFDLCINVHFLTYLMLNVVKCLFCEWLCELYSDFFFTVACNPAAEKCGKNHNQNEKQRRFKRKFLMSIK